MTRVLTKRGLPLLATISSVFITSCAEESQPTALEVESPEPKIAEIPPASAEPDSQRSPELEKELDAFFAEREDMDDIQTMMSDPTILEMMNSMMEGFEPSPELEERMTNAMQMLMVSKMPDSPLAEAVAEGTPEELKESGHVITVGMGDPELIRDMVGYALMQDAEGFSLMFCEAMEESAIASLADPDAETPVSIEAKSGPNSEPGDPEGN